MDSFFNTNFLIGFLLAKDRPRDEALSIGLAASQLPPNNIVGTLILKKEVDKVSEAEKKNVELEEDMRKVAEILQKAKDDLKNNKNISKDEKRKLNAILGRFNFKIELSEICSGEEKSPKAK